MPATAPGPDGDDPQARRLREISDQLDLLAGSTTDLPLALPYLQGMEDALREAVSLLESEGQLTDRLKLEVAGLQCQIRRLQAELRLQDEAVLRLEEFVQLLEQLHGGGGSLPEQRQVMNNEHKCLSLRWIIPALVLGLATAFIVDLLGPLTLAFGHGSWVSGGLMVLVTVGLVWLSRRCPETDFGKTELNNPKPADVTARDDAKRVLDDAENKLGEFKKKILGDSAAAAPEDIMGKEKLLRKKQDDLLSATNDQDILSHDLSTLMTNADALRSQLGVLAGQVATLSSEKSDLFADLANLRKELAGLLKATPPNPAAVTAKETEVTAKEGQIMAKQTEITAKAGALTAKQAEVAAKEGEVAAKKAELLAKVHEVMTAGVAVRSLKAELYDTGGLHAEVDKLEKAINVGDPGGTPPGTAPTKALRLAYEESEAKLRNSVAYRWQLCRVAIIFALIVLWWDMLNVNNMVRQSRINRGDEPGWLASGNLPEPDGRVRTITVVYETDAFRFGDRMNVGHVNSEIVVRANVKRTDGRRADEFMFLTSLPDEKE